MDNSRMMLGGILAAVALLPIPGAASAPLDRVAWLQGCWTSVTLQRTVEEQWMAPRGGAMLGMGRTVRNSALVEYELVLLREQEGSLVYQAHPSGQPSAAFPLRDFTDTSVLFENAEHDFPQRVGYRRDGPDAMLAWIEGTRNGQLRRVEFAYRRVACPGA